MHFVKLPLSNTTYTTNPLIAALVGTILNVSSIMQLGPDSKPTGSRRATVYANAALYCYYVLFRFSLGDNDTIHNIQFDNPELESYCDR